MSLTIRLDTTSLTQAADRLGALDTAALRAIREATVDVVSLSVKKAAAAETVRQLNVSADYVEQRLERKRGRREVLLTQDLVVSEVRGTTLQRFGEGVKQNTRPANWSNADILRLTGKHDFTGGVAVGPRARLPNGVYSRIWTQRTGNAARGIPANMKADGVSVDVNRKGMRRIASGFILPLRNNNGMGVFQRQGGKIKHLYGPSVYQVFRRYASEKEADIMRELQEDFMSRLDTQLSKL